MVPFAIFFFFYSRSKKNLMKEDYVDDTNEKLAFTEEANNDDKKIEKSKDNRLGTITATEKISLKEEAKIIGSKPIWISLTAGYAASTGSLIALSTFGSAFVMGLGYFNSEQEASTTFGVIVSIAGVV